MQVIIATRNQGKVKEFQRILAPLGITAVSQDEAGIGLEVEETGATFEDNAALKARAIYKAAGKATVADDSGLMVDALHGAPGVYSARYAGPDATDCQKYEKLLRELTGVPMEKRGAKFVCAIHMILPDGQEITVRGECPGVIGLAPAGAGGFGYDPVFYVGEKSFGELTPEEKDKLSHRGKALRMLSEKLQKMGEE